MITTTNLSVRPGEALRVPRAPAVSLQGRLSHEVIDA